MKTIAAPQNYNSLRHKNAIKVFIAGGITNCPDWQSTLISVLSKVDFGSEYDVVLFNPRRKDFDTSDPNAAAEQITWEYNRLRDADIICFWFSKGSLNPIVLYELGMWGNSRDEPIVIGCDSKYERKQDVIVQTSLADPNKKVHASFVSFVKDIEKTIREEISRRDIEKGIDAKFEAFG
jgi:hypothetical protein